MKASWPLMRAAQALAGLRGREYVLPDDVKQLAVSVLAHRLILLGGLGGPERKPLRAEGGLLWYQTVAFRWEVTASRRGLHSLGPHRLVAGDLLGFFSRVGTEGNGLHVVVYPRIVPLRPFPLPRRDFFGIPGAEGPVKDPVFILGTRDYQPGRPAKHIHWKASARLGAPA